MELNDLDYEELSKFKNGPCEVPDIRSPRLQRLIDSGYLEASACMQLPDGDYVSTHYRLTLAGEDALAEYERRQNEMSEQRAQKCADKISDRRFQLLNSFLSAVTGSLLTLLVEHWESVIKFIRDLFA